MRRTHRQLDDLGAGLAGLGHHQVGRPLQPRLAEGPLTAGGDLRSYRLDRRRLQRSATWYRCDAG